MHLSTGSAASIIHPGAQPMDRQKIHTIDWRAHGAALHSPIAKRIHLPNKEVLHERLPMFQGLNIFTPGDQKCPHMVERGRWRISFMEHIEAFHELENTSPLLRHVWARSQGVMVCSSIRANKCTILAYLVPDGRRTSHHSTKRYRMVADIQWQINNCVGICARWILCY